jgi:hypothetical protein
VWSGYSRAAYFKIFFFSFLLQSTHRSYHSSLRISYRRSDDLLLLKNDVGCEKLSPSHEKESRTQRFLFPHFAIALHSPYGHFGHLSNDRTATWEPRSFHSPNQQKRLWSLWGERSVGLKKKILSNAKENVCH